MDVYSVDLPSGAHARGRYHSGHGTGRTRTSTWHSLSRPERTPVKNVRRRTATIQKRSVQRDCVSTFVSRHQGGTAHWGPVSRLPKGSSSLTPRPQGCTTRAKGIHLSFGPAAIHRTLLTRGIFTPQTGSARPSRVAILARVSQSQPESARRAPGSKPGGDSRQSQPESARVDAKGSRLK